MNKWKLNNKGITLVELLATLAIVGMISALAYTVLFQGYSNYERVKIETELRDEADLIMASFIKELFVLKASEIDKLKLACSEGSPGSYLEYTKSDSSQPAKTGFENGKIIVKGTLLQLTNDDVSLVPNNCSDIENGINYGIETSDSNLRQEVTVRFTLTTEIRGEERQMSFENSISLISDDEGGLGNENSP